MEGLPVITRAALAALALLVALTLWQRGQLVQAAARIDAMTRELATAAAIQAQQAEAAAVHRAHIARLTAEAAAWADLTNDLQSMEGRDAPLSDHLRNASRRLWP
jgi:hypothetical protein